MACNAYLLACNVCKHDPNFIGQVKENFGEKQKTREILKQIKELIVH